MVTGTLSCPHSEYVRNGLELPKIHFLFDKRETSVKAMSLLEIGTFAPQPLGHLNQVNASEFSLQPESHSSFSMSNKRYSLRKSM